MIEVWLTILNDAPTSLRMDGNAQNLSTFHVRSFGFE